MANIKQVIVVRGDLPELLKRKGKLAAQVSHASLGAVFSESVVKDDSFTGSEFKMIPMNPVLAHWFNEEFTKVVVKCENEQQLLQLHEKVKQAGLLNALIKDAGHTVFSEPTYTCLGIGPAVSGDIDAITGSLPLL